MAVRILINVRPNLTRVAYVENQTLIDLKVEKRGSPTMVGSVFKGKVLRVLPGMQAAFVDIGLDRAAFLYVGDVRDEVVRDGKVLAGDTLAEDEESLILEDAEPRVEAPRPQIQDLLSEGQTLMVQVAKDPLGTKGARITTHVSFPGRLLVYMPTLQQLGVSRRIEDEGERERLRKIVEDLEPSGGVIVRTAGEDARDSEIASDLDYLDRVWKEVESAYQRKKEPGVVHTELSVELRALRDLLSDEVAEVIVDDKKVYENLLGFVSQFMPKFEQRISFYQGMLPLFDRYNIDLEVSRSLERKIWLKSGGYIIIDEAEALVVIDVNTGRFVGKKDLEDTILKTNIEAAHEIAHQVRIRNCGGIIIADFIDMEKEAHREKILQILEQELAKDRARTAVISMSQLGLVEMTRKRIRPSLVSSLCEPCPYCDGKGYIKRKATIASEIFRDLERESSRGAVGSLVVRCHSEIADWIYEEETETLEFIEKKLGRTVAFKVEPSFHLEQHETTVYNSK